MTGYFTGLRENGATIQFPVERFTMIIVVHVEFCRVHFSVYSSYRSIGFIYILSKF